MATDLDATRAWTDESTLNFVRYMFKNKNNRRYVVGDHHRIIAEAIDHIIAGDPKYRYTMINVPPRYGKTELIKSLVGKGLAVNPQSLFLHVSYSGDLVIDNSREILETVKSDYYRRLYPDVFVTDRGTKKWRTSVGGGLYAVASGGQVTGFGAGQVNDVDDPDLVDYDEAAALLPEQTGYRFSGAILVDDPLKPEDAVSDVMRERVNARFESTIRSRANSRFTPIVIIMQRLHERDLCGYLLKTEGSIEEGGKWNVICLPAISVDEAGNERPLWPFKHSLAELHHLQEVEPYVFDTQYMQNARPQKGLMYSLGFREYDTLPVGHYIIKNYTDTADKGTDFLSSGCYAEFDNGDCYMLDVLYTDKPMEYTEPETARMLTRNKVKVATIESNNGGRGFRRKVEGNCRSLGNSATSFIDLDQTANKEVRIFGRSAEVQNTIFMPRGWNALWPLFYNAVTSFRREGRNLHDDAPDMLTGICETKGGFAKSTWSRTK